MMITLVLLTLAALAQEPITSCDDVKTMIDLWNMEIVLADKAEVAFIYFWTEGAVALNVPPLPAPNNPAQREHYTALKAAVTDLDNSLVALNELKLRSAPFVFGRNIDSIGYACNYKVDQVTELNRDTQKKLDKVQALMKTINAHQIRGLPPK